MMWNDVDWDLQHVRMQSGKAMHLRILDTSRNILSSEGKTLERRCLEVCEKRQGGQSCGQVADQTVWLHYVRSESGYIAVSCPWRLHGSDDVVSGKYRIERDKSIKKFHVPQDMVLDRVTKFASTKGLPFWIDKLCIDQLEGSAEKDIALESMDLIYKHSTLSLGLISVRIDSRKHVEILQDLLSGTCVTEVQDSDGKHQYRLNVPSAKRREILKILYLIVKDIWWERAWIFQEEYLSGIRMRLLIRSSVLKYPSSSLVDFGDIPGELELSVVRFREQATRFCLAVCQHAQISRIQRSHCRTILQRAGKYTILLPQKNAGKILEAMSPTIFGEIGRRNITCISDILAIASNSCDYSIRLDLKKFRRNERSLSLAILTTYLLNGEILGQKSITRKNWAGNIFDYLKWNTLGVEPPLQEKGLTFIKHCRFPNVILSRSGIVTEGIIWKLCKRIDTRLFSRAVVDMTSAYHLSSDLHTKINAHRLWSTSPRNLKYNEHKALWLLVDWLLYGESKSYQELASFLITFLEDVAPEGYDEDWSWRHIMYLMSISVARAVQNGRQLHLGSIACGTAYSPYTAIFVENRYRRKSSGCFAFTAWARAREIIEENRLARSCSKYASLEIDCDDSTVDLPRVVPRAWLNGLCFFQNVDAKEVVVRWPKF
jgi:hypothetical protein